MMKKGYKKGGKVSTPVKTAKTPKKTNGVTISSEIPNPLALNLYVLGYDNTKKLTQLNLATKNNLRTFCNISTWGKNTGL